MDVGVFIHPDQPEMIIVCNMKDKEEGLRKILSLCWEKFPGFFLDYPQNQGAYQYKGKFLSPGYPIVEEITWN